MLRLALFAAWCWSLAALRGESDIPEDWVSKVQSYDAFYSANDDGPLISDGYPAGIYLPLIGNGYFSHSKGVRSDTYFIAGVYNGETTSPSHRARIPATLAATIDNSTTTGTLLNIREGCYIRRGDIIDSDGAWYELKWYANMHRRNLYAMELRVYFGEDAAEEANVTLYLTNNNGAPSEDVNFSDVRKVEVLIDAATSVNAIMQCGDTLIPETSESSTTHICMISSDVSQGITVSKPHSGQPITFLTAVRTSLDSDDPLEDVISDFKDGLDLTLLAHHSPKGVPAGLRGRSVEEQSLHVPLYEEHIAAWAERWQGGIEVSGNRGDVAAAVNASLFAMLSSVRSDWPYGLAPGGLTNYYNGHSFWDTETWMYPNMLLFQPSIAQSLMKYRFERIDGARAKAQSYSPPYEGAMFPWESAFTGTETCPTWADTGLREQHISADISLAVWQYWSATGDLSWLKEVGFPILQGVADFFVSRVTITSDDAGNDVAHIYEVIPPDEYVSSCNDSVYTNYGAAAALRYAVAAGDILGASYSDKYAQIADQLVILFDVDQGIHPEYDGYKGDTIKQADVVLLSYPWGMPMTQQERASDLDYYSARTDANGPAMTWGMHAIGYKDLANFDDAALFFNRSFQDNLQAPFNVWTETPQGNAANFITGAGGFLQTVSSGYAGVRFYDTTQLRIDAPTCPPGVSSVKLRGMWYRGRAIDFKYSCTTATTAAANGGSGGGLTEGNGDGMCNEVAPSSLQVLVHPAGPTAEEAQMLHLLVYGLDGELASLIPLPPGEEVSLTDVQHSDICLTQSFGIQEI